VEHHEKGEAVMVELDLSAAQVARDRAVAVVEANASEAFSVQAFSALCAVAAREETLIVDDIWVELGEDAPETRDKRAMGAVMQRGRREKVIAPTNDFRPSAQKQCHANPRRVWRTL
jgi:hypothetical protein